MSRWRAQLDGELFDLEEFPRWFPRGNVFATREESGFYLQGPALDECRSDEEVLQRARASVEQFFSVISVLVPNLKVPTVELLICEEADGTLRKLQYAEAHCEARSKVSGFSAGYDPDAETLAQQMLEGASSNVHLGAALNIWAAPNRNWPRLFTVLEEIERARGEKQVNPDFCSDNERERFIRTANVAAGIDRRHAHGKHIPPKNPMTFAEGLDFVRRMLDRSLREVISTLPRNTSSDNTTRKSF